MILAIKAEKPSLVSLSKEMASLSLKAA